MCARKAGQALEGFVDRQMAELRVENWDRDEPDRPRRLAGLSPEVAQAARLV
jgi:hypothetical protein